MNPQIWWYLTRAAGIVAWLMLTASVIWGIVLSTKAFPEHRRPAWLLDLHRWLGGLAVAFTAIHLGALVADSYVHFGLADVTVPFASQWKPGAVALGIAAMWLLVAVEATSLAMKRLPRRTWRLIHLSSYAVFLGKEVFEPLAKRMEELPDLRVLLFLNVPAPGGTDLDPDAVARDYYREFLKRNWPAGRPPELYFDPRSLAAKADERGVIHAKCIVIDGQTALVTSANFTEAAHARNIEAGVVVHDAAFATSLEQQFTSLVASGVLRRVMV